MTGLMHFLSPLRVCGESLSLIPIEEVEEWRKCMLPSFSTNLPKLLIQLFYPCLWGWGSYLPPGYLYILLGQGWRGTLFWTVTV